jgi:sporulation protein YlmC with PRC-barrel domain
MNKPLLAALFSAVAVVAATNSLDAQQQPVQPVAPQATQQPMQAAPMQPDPALMQNGFFIAQQADQMLASNLMGRPVIGAAAEHIGDVDDVLLDSEGRAIGILVGIGGFLGIGQHDVAISVEQAEFVLVGDLATGAVTTPGAPPAPAVAPRTAPARGWGWRGWMGGQIDHVQVPYTRPQLEAAPNFMRVTD